MKIEDLKKEFIEKINLEIEKLIISIEDIDDLSCDGKKVFNEIEKFKCLRDRI
jgi:hypothetical protein